MKDTEQFVELQRMFSEIRKRDVKLPKTQKNNKVLWTILENEWGTYEQCLEKAKNSDDLSKKLQKLKREIVKEYSEILFKTKYNDIFLAQANFDLGLDNVARKQLKNAWDNVQTLDYWQRWHLIELESDNYSPNDRIGFNLEYYKHIRSLAMSLTGSYSEYLEPQIKTLPQTTLLRIMREIKKLRHSLDDYISELDLLKQNALEFKFESEILSEFEKIEYPLIINQFFDLSFELIMYLRDNSALIKDSKDKIIDTLKSIVDFCETVRFGSSYFLPNILTVYFINRCYQLSSAIYLLPNEIRNDVNIQIHPELYLNKTDIRNNVVIYDALIDILIFDGFEFKQGKTHLKMLEDSLGKIIDILDGNKEGVLLPEAELGLKCIYVLLLRILRKSDRKSLNDEFRYSNLIEKELMTETRYKNDLVNVLFYKDILKLKGNDFKHKPSNILQLVCIKLNVLYSGI